MSNPVSVSVPTITPDRRRLWLAAIKPPMYTVAIIPISVGTAVAYAETKTLNYPIFITFLLGAIAIIAWLNLTNDVFDSETGIDVNKAHSVVNLTGNKNLVFLIANLFLILGLISIGTIAWWQQDLTVIAIILMSCALGYTYQGPPFRLGYQGLGEIICFLTFGPLAIAAAYYSQTQTISLSSIIPIGTIIGITTSIILFCSHFHQVEDDLKAGKKSPVARLGTATSANLLNWFCGSVFALIVMAVIAGILPMASLLIFGSLPLAIKLCRHVNENHNLPDKVNNSKFIAVALHFWSGLLLSLGLIA